MISFEILGIFLEILGVALILIDFYRDHKSTELVPSSYLMPGLETRQQLERLETYLTDIQNSRNQAVKIGVFGAISTLVGLLLQTSIWW